MSSINIIFVVSKYLKFQWFDSLESLEEKEIENSILILRGALSAFSAELTDRRIFKKDQSLDNHKMTLEKTAQRINTQGLSQTDENYLNTLNLYITQEDVKDKTKKATTQIFWQTAKLIGWPYVFLIVCALGKHRFAHHDEDHRIKLIKFIAQNRKTFFCQSLQDKVIQFDFEKKGTNLD